MKLTELLGLNLKEATVIDVLNDYAVGNVTYDFDRQYENAEDVYWAPAYAAGFQLRFGADQKLDTIFCYIVANEGFAPIAPDIVGVPIHRDFDAAEAACKAAGQAYRVADPARFPRLWLRADDAQRLTHYQFKEGRLALVTLMLPGR